MRNFTSLGIDVNQIAARTVGELPLCYLEGEPGWVGADHGSSPCAICGDRPLRAREYCCGCDRCGADDLVTWPGLPARDPERDWESRPRP